jgi:hypothetical protein
VWEGCFKSIEFQTRSSSPLPVLSKAEGMGEVRWGKSDYPPIAPYIEGRGMVSYREGYNLRGDGYNEQT